MERAQIGRKIFFDKYPALARLGAGDLAPAGLFRHGGGVQSKEAGRLLESDGVHGVAPDR